MTRRLYNHPAGILLATALLLAACNHNNASDHDLQLLTSDPWQYEQAGFSTDGQQDEESASFNALDPIIAGSTKDNVVVFHTDGTGSDNRLPFTWSFQNNDSVLLFQDQYYKVKTLTKKRLIMYADQQEGRINTHYMIVLKH